MTLVKTLAAAAVSLTLMTACNDETNNHFPIEPEPKVDVLRIGAFNLSFDRFTFEDLVTEMAISKFEQDKLVKGYVEQTLNDEDKKIALKVIQIRNVAAIIQHQRPAVLMVSEFNNDGVAEDNSAISGFSANYLAVAQSLNSIDGTDLQQPIHYPYFGNYSTNTGLNSGFDLDNDGDQNGPGDAWGFGNYHGQYAFGLLSQHPIDNANVRTFQQFKWQDMLGETNIPVNCKPENTASWCNNNFWYTDEAWPNMRLSSKNHVDVPIEVTTEAGKHTIHLLMSHPTPPVFDKGEEAPYNQARNAAEVNFWVDYINGENYFYDDKGQTGGLNAGESFVVMGDLNADPENGDGDLTSIKALMTHEKVNHLVTTGSYAPSSNGAPECLVNGECGKQTIDSTPYPQLITSTFGLRVDHVIPSTDLNVIDSGVFWPASSEAGYLLMNDKRIGKYGNGKDVSSDHRMVWIDIEL